MATKFRFNRDYDYEIRDKKSGALLQTFAYRKGEYDNVLDAHATAAEEAGAGERIKGGSKEAKADGGRKAG